ncbi:hypothetical protein AB1L30_03665 [Bremerella sp. JC817]|uniref:hypothetical protein n=1 Tax=Bremerella sp. JC817 TaxID=3231756 RepID=UPI0034573B60
MASETSKSNASTGDHIVVRRVEEARRGAMRRVRVRGTAWAVVAAVAFLLGMALFDYLLRQDDIGTRWFLSLITFGGVLFCGYFWLLPAWRWAPSLQQIAQRIEQFFPEMRDRISSALFFLGQDEKDASGSSTYFRHKQINETAATLTYTDLSVALNRNLATRAVYATIGMTLVLLSVMFFSPQQLTTAVARLAMPWKTIEWPRHNNLALVDPPLVVPMGGRATIMVEDINGRMPEQLELQVRYQPDERPMVHPMQLDLESNQMVYQLDGIQRPFEFRVEGGDDDTMAWYSVDVVKPPKFTDIQVTLVPPEYTRWLPSESPRSIIALAGTSLQLRGKVDQTITQAEFVFDAAGETQAFPLVIGEDGKSFSTPPGSESEPVVGPVLEKSGNYWIEVTVDSGLKKGEGQRFPVRVIPDKTPIVSWIAPDRNLSLTASAMLDLSAGVRDDLRTENVKLAVTRPADATVLVDESVYIGPEEIPFETAPSNLAMGQGEDLEIVYSLDFAKLDGLVPGTVLELIVSASDYRPQSGKSLPRVITIISDEQLDQRVNRQQRDIISKIADARRLQQDARQQTRSVEIQLNEGSKLGPAEMANLQNGEQNQKNVRDKLVGGKESALAKIDQLLNELKQNRKPDHDATEMLEDLKQKIEGIANQELTPIENEMTQLRRQTAQAGQTSSPNGEGEPSGEQPDQPKEEGATEPDAGQPGEKGANEQQQQTQEKLKEVGERQENVAGQLQDWQNDLNKWDTFRRFAMDVRELASRQEDLSRAVDEKQADMIGKDVERMTPDERADLKQMAEQQTGLAGELDQIQSRMRDMLQNKPDSEDVSNTLKDAIAENRDSAVSQRMRQAGQRIEQNKLSSAKDSQDQVQKSLEDVLDTLQNRREIDKKELKRKLDEAKQELEELQEQQKELKQKATEAKNQADRNDASPMGQQSRQKQLERLKEQAQQMQQQAERLARKLERLSARKAAEKVRDAAERLEEAAKNAQNMDPEQLQEEIDQAQQDLEDAQQELEEQQEQVEQDLADEQAAKLKQSIDQLIIRQTRIRDELTRLEKAQSVDGQLTPAQQQTILGLSLEQAAITDEIRSFAEAIAKAEVYHLSLLLTAEVTTDLARILDTSKVDRQALALADEAVERLEQLVAAMEEEQKQKQGEQQQQQNQDQQDHAQQNQQQQQGSQDGISQTAQLRLLKLMQQSLKGRTEKAGKRMAENPNANDQAELARLASEQGRLSEMTLNLIKNTEEEMFDPDSLPDLEQTVPGEEEGNEP